MNKDLIQKFLNKACWDVQAQYELEDWLNVERFAQLIVKECMDIAINAASNTNFITGISEADKRALSIAVEINKHFGVEE
jgi:hypothetical protein